MRVVRLTNLASIIIVFLTAMWELDYLEQCGSSNADFKEVGCL